MSSEQDRVIVSTATSGNRLHTQVHHRDFPEIRAEGETTAAASQQLVNHLTRALDSALTTWRREAIQSAISEVQAFAEASS
jgi:hypothetical protein